MLPHPIVIQAFLSAIISYSFLFSSVFGTAIIEIFPGYGINWETHRIRYYSTSKSATTDFDYKNLERQARNQARKKAEKIGKEFLLQKVQNPDVRQILIKKPASHFTGILFSRNTIYHPDAVSLLSELRLRRFSFKNISIPTLLPMCKKGSTSSGLLFLLPEHIKPILGYYIIDQNKNLRFDWRQTKTTAMRERLTGHWLKSPRLRRITRLIGKSFIKVEILRILDDYKFMIDWQGYSTQQQEDIISTLCSGRIVFQVP